MRSIPINSSYFLLASVVAAVSLVEILDYFALPFESVIAGSMNGSTFLSGLVSIMFASGYVGLFILMFLENMSLPIPSEVFLPLAGYLVFLGKMTFAAALSVSVFAGLLGSLAIYFIALSLGRPLVYGFAKKIGVSENSLTKSEAWLSGKGGVLLIFIARFIPGIRSSISLPAGVLKMEPIRFSLMTFIGTLGWSLLLIFIGYSTGRYWPVEVASFSGLLSQAVLYAVAVTSIFYVTLFLITFLRRRH